eukprot:GILJ01008122.1.p1 GENE.GILJ01008122.1~~GILJ01008122.1.p1  ORF type:complete len:130 (+),score=17.03 GILJ01008122.1:46-435(+)
MSFLSRTLTSTPKLFRSFASATSRVRMVKSADEYRQTLDAAKDKLAVVYFTASWCPPCRQISPIYDNLSQENPSVEFLKVDVDELDDVAQSAGVQAMPTFVFKNKGDTVDKIVGADPKKLKQLVDQYKS